MAHDEASRREKQNNVPEIFDMILKKVSYKINELLLKLFYLKASFLKL